LGFCQNGSSKRFVKSVRQIGSSIQSGKFLENTHGSDQSCSWRSAGGKGSTENKVNDKSDYESNQDATSANPQSPKTSTVKKIVPQAPVTPAMRNEGIAFGFSGLLAYLIGTGSGNRKQEVKTQSRNDQENDA